METEVQCLQQWRCAAPRNNSTRPTGAHHLVSTDVTCKLHRAVQAPCKEVGGAGGVGTSGT